MLKEHVTEIL